MPNEPHRVLVALGQAGDGLPTVIIGMAEEAWKYCQDGKTHTVDLASAGIPIRVIIFGGKDHEELNTWLKAHNSTIDDVVPDNLPILGEDSNEKLN